MVGFIIPFTPYVLYSQLLSVHATWRWSMWITLIYNGLVFLGIATTYFPQAHPRAEGFSKRKILSEIDYIGAALSIVGITILYVQNPHFQAFLLIAYSLVALQAGGYSHPWISAYVLAQLIIGIILILAWIVWEWKFAKNPMIPHKLFSGQRVVGLAFFVAFVAGMNFYSLINFYPLTFATVYDPDPIQIGLKGLGYGISVTVGAVLFNAMLSVPRIHARYVLLVAAVLMSMLQGPP
jgi:hypothetical protein